MSIQLLHGPDLADKPIKRGRPVSRPKSWQYAARFNTDMAHAVDQIALQTGQTPSDVIRTAMADWLSRVTKTEYVNIDISASADQTPTASPSPVTADRWRGSGGADMQNVRRVNQSNAKRKATGKAGERLQD